MSPAPIAMASLPSPTLPPLPHAPPGGLPAMSDGLVASHSTRQDRAEQGRLYDLCFGMHDGERLLPWRYDRCPAGATIAPIARDARGALVASYACSPRQVRFRGEDPGECRVGQTGDVMTHPELRSRGVFSALHWRAMSDAHERGWVAAWGLPNRYSGRIFFGKLGWKLAGHIGQWNFVLASTSTARAIRLHSGRLAMWGTPWAAWRGAQRRSALRARASGLRREPLARFDPQVDRLSEAVEPRFDWMVHRDAAYLNWRFFDAPSGRFEALAVRDASDHLVGYAVVQRPLAGEVVGIVSDLLGIDPAAEGAALDGALELLAARGASIARAYAMRGSHWARLLAQGGFRSPRGEKPVGAYALEGDHPLAGATLDTSRWWFTDGDRDAECVR